VRPKKPTKDTRGFGSMDIIGILFLILLITLALWQLISKWQASREIKQEGIVVHARVTDIKEEARLVKQLGWSGATYHWSGATYQKYEPFLYARYEDPSTQNMYTFRIQISRPDRFTIGETILIKMNRNDPHEYYLVG
jgi:hypothetical protein